MIGENVVTVHFGMKGKVNESRFFLSYDVALDGDGAGREEGGEDEKDLHGKEEGRRAVGGSWVGSGLAVVSVIIGLWYYMRGRYVVVLKWGRQGFICTPKGWGGTGAWGAYGTRSGNRQHFLLFLIGKSLS